MSFKKLCLLFAAALVCLILASCSNGEQTASNESSTKQAKVENNTESDQSDKKEKESDNRDDSPKTNDKGKSGNNNNDKEESKQNKQSGNDNKEKLLPEGILEHGDSGPKIKKLQQALNKIGYSLSINSEFDWTMVWVVKDFQAQLSALETDGIYGSKTRGYIQKAINGDIGINPGSGMAKNTEQNDNAKKNKTNNQQSQIVSDPSSILVLVNKNNRLPADYVPENLVVPDVRFPFDADLPKRQMRQVAANALEDMFRAADKDGVDLFAQSGYRSYDRQEAIFAANASEHGREAANQFSAQAGESEHQTGLTMDVTSPDINYRLITDFANTDEGQWIKKHAREYGFIVRYPKGKTEITDYQYEPWHLRYVGGKAANAIDRMNITLEEYLGAAK
ncbi:D-alanyl-D-alanine carboxypeptidase family protein [Virgibacillus doumboii]|uniref:D-alanyl-D-alanine carboxypeptidase family protein n=1 Tax=Virgibacillus doumboii TaxID=2697503 RepID=UPI0019670F4A|nr:D-alanyl-D-alanine carboxypeptidase family protein [Virgibacillus doumboii]